MIIINTLIGSIEAEILSGDGSMVYSGALKSLAYIHITFWEGGEMY